MASVICPKCGAENVAGEITCRKCGITLKDAQEDPAQSGSLKRRPSHGEQASPEEPQKTKCLGCAANVMRWIGRLWGLVLILFLPILLFFNYSSFPEGSGPAYLVVFITIIVGMIVAWWQEGLGALVSLAGLAGFYAAVWAYEKSNFQTWAGASLVFVLPPIGFLLASSLLRRHTAAKSLERGAPIGQEHA
jgi:hypothetical protein